VRARPVARLILVVLGLAVTSGTASGDDGDLRTRVREAGLVPYWSFKSADDFTYPDVATGRPTSLASFKGRVVLINVWATWCPPCVEEMPSLQALHDQLHARGLVVLGVNIRDRKNAGAVVEWLQRRKLTFLNVKAHDDGPRFPSRVSIPQTFLVDRRGRLIANRAGSWDWSGESVKSMLGRMLE
jgi:thiol-disulfide isomerase/thioredoxin